MNKRTLGKTGFDISPISLGTWQVGGKWGSTFDHQRADQILNSAVDQGVNFIDTADVYSEGLSEQAVGKFVRSRSERIYVATKCGRQINPHVADGYQPKVLRAFVEQSLSNLGLETIDLIQLHCPPPAVYYRPEIFDLFTDLKKEGKILHLGVSVEKVEEGLKAMEYDQVSTIQIIYNMFRQRPDELFFQEAERRNVGVIVRVPLASGLLTGLFDAATTFTADDHRFFNREGAAFDKGETFAGIPYQQGLSAVAALKEVFPDATNLAPIALRWILAQSAVSTIIPGASSVEQVASNISALSLPSLSMEQTDAVSAIYNSSIKPHVHQIW